MSTIARLGLVGDPHAEDDRLALALERLGGERVDAIACTGDVVDGHGDADRCARLLEGAGALVVRGNHDRWLLEGRERDPSKPPRAPVAEATRRWLAALPPTRRLETTAGAVLLCHGLGANDMARVNPDDEGYALEANTDLEALRERSPERIVINGHSHRRMVRRFGDLVIVNAGTLLRDRGPCFAVVDFVEGRVRFLEIGADLSVAPGANLRLDGRP